MSAHCGKRHIMPPEFDGENGHSWHCLRMTGHSGDCAPYPTAEAEYAEEANLARRERDGAEKMAAEIALALRRVEDDRTALRSENADLLAKLNLLRIDVGLARRHREVALGAQAFLGRRLIEAEKREEDLLAQVNAVTAVINAWQTRYERAEHDSGFGAFYGEVLGALNGTKS